MTAIFDLDWNDSHDDALEQAQADLAYALDFAKELVRALEAATQADTRAEYFKHFDAAHEQHEELEIIIARRDDGDDQLGLRPPDVANDVDKRGAMSIS